MRLPNNAHVAIVDGENFIVMRNSGTALEPKLGSSEKPDLSVTNFSAGVKHQDPVSQQHGRTDLNELAHGAAAAEWLNEKSISGEISILKRLAKCGAIIIRSWKNAWSVKSTRHCRVKPRRKSNRLLSIPSV